MSSEERLEAWCPRCEGYQWADWSQWPYPAEWKGNHELLCLRCGFVIGRNRRLAPIKPWQWGVKR